MMRRPAKPRLMDDSAFAIKRVKVHVRKPDAWWRSRDHLSYVAGLRCLGCGRESPERATDNCPRNQATHVRKGTDGAAKEKPSDYFTVPLCAHCHIRQHMGEVTFWRVVGIDPILRALEIAMQSTCERTRSAALEEWRRRYEEVGNG